MVSPFLILLASLIWASDSFVRMPLSTFLGGGLLLLLENGITLVLALLCSVFVVLRFKASWTGMKKRWDWLKFLLLGVLGSALGNHLYTRSIDLLGASAPNVFLMMQPAIVLVLARFFLKERQSSFFYQLSIWIMLNAVVIAFPDFSFGFTVAKEGDLWTGSLFGLGASLAYALSTIVGKDLIARYAPIVLVTFRAFFAFLVVLIGHSWEERVLEPWTVAHVLELTYLTAGVGLGGMLLYYYGLKKVPASFAAFVELIYPLGGIFIPVIVMGGELSPFQALGAVALLMALFLQWKATEKKLF